MDETDHLGAAYHTFRDEITQYNVATDRTTGDKFRFYLLNRRFEHVQPVVIYNGFGSTPNTTLGQRYLWSYAQQLDRPIIAPMADHVHRRTDRRQFADSHAHALARLHPGPLHVAGMSWGGIVAYSVAESLQDNADHLVTLSSVGTMDGLHRHAWRALHMLRREGPIVRDAIETIVGDFDPHDHEHPAPTMDPLSKIRRSMIMRRRSLHELPDTLHPSTTWHDIIGVHDALTSHSDHIDAVLRRNTRHPGSTSITVIRNHGHMWAHMRPTLAELLADALHRKEAGHYQEATIARTSDDFTSVENVPGWGVGGGGGSGAGGGFVADESAKNDSDREEG
ncbi:thioesterase domain-containing protein [Lolliginicoccus suaedae]|uniref:thioesterase domain-containing protein n=1 Tax=Lolliginicoccus suaedae TaxID=2605429 RepID=UPI001659C3F5|nr:thioesterase domain-containing protein [Lolliginicoccus suaedae]